MICRPTQKEAEDYHHYANVENADWRRGRRMLALKDITPQNTPRGGVCRQAPACRPSAASAAIRSSARPTRSPRSSPIIGRAGVRGIAVSFVNYLNEVPYFCAEVLPRLKRMGLRAN